MDADDLTQVRIAENQSAFRKANEHIDERADALGIEGKIPLICECADPACTEIVRFDRAAYEEIRSDPRRFFNAPGHELVSVEAGAAVVLDERDGYVVVEKVGIAGEVAAAEYDEKAV
jgi:hypothetical protein